MEWITRVETPCDTVIYLSSARRQLFLASRRLEHGGEPIAGVDLTNVLSGELPDLRVLTKWFVAEHVDPSDPSFVAVFDFGHPAAAAILCDKHPMTGIGLVGAPEPLLTAEDYRAGRAAAIPAGGGVELLPISTDLGALVEGFASSHLALVLAGDQPETCDGA